MQDKQHMKGASVLVFVETLRLSLFLRESAASLLEYCLFYACGLVYVVHESFWCVIIPLQN